MSPPPGNETFGKPSERAVLVRLEVCAAVFVVIAFSLRLAAAFWNYYRLDATGGIWLATALEASRGILYRPIQSAMGYGGSRYAPLHIVLHAGLIRMGIGAVHSGFFLDSLSLVMALAGLFVLMRQLRVPTIRSAVITCFVLATYCYFTATAGIKADVMAAGLNLWGLAAIVRGKQSGARFMWVAAAVCFTLALAAKMTSVFGIASAFLWLGFQRDWRRAFFLGLLWMAGVILAIAATQWASGGRALGIFRLCAMGGGLGQIPYAPRHLLNVALHKDRVFLVLWILAAIAALAGRRWTSLPVIFFVIATGGTLLILGSPGTNSNHFVDLAAASLLVIAMPLEDRKISAALTLMVTVVVALAGLEHLRQAVLIMRDGRYRQLEAALDDIPPAGGPLLSQNPLVPILKGERPFMLDGFMFRTLWMNDPRLADGFWNDLSHRRFRAVILSSPLSDPDYSNNTGEFGPGFVPLLEKNYALKSVHDDFYVYVPAR